jgi:hypothetical protein
MQSARGGSSGEYILSASTSSFQPQRKSDNDSISSNNNDTINQPFNETSSYASNGISNGISNAFNVGGVSRPLTPSLIQGWGYGGGNSKVALTRPTGTNDTLFEEERAMQEDDGRSRRRVKRIWNGEVSHYRFPWREQRQ